MTTSGDNIQNGFCQTTNPRCAISILASRLGPWLRRLLPSAWKPVAVLPLPATLFWSVALPMAVCPWRRCRTWLLELEVSNDHLHLVSVGRPSMGSKGRQMVPIRVVEIAQPEVDVEPRATRCRNEVP